jgi:hypothetical protein
VDTGATNDDVEEALADLTYLRHRHAGDPSLSALVTSTTAKLMVSTMRTHHGAYDRMTSLNRMLRTLLSSASPPEVGSLAENLVKNIVRPLSV